MKAQNWEVKYRCSSTSKEDENINSVQKFNSYDDALCWAVNHADEISSASISNEDLSQEFNKKELKCMEYIYNNICKV